MSTKSATRLVKEHTASTLESMEPDDWATEEVTGVVVHRTPSTGRWAVADGAGGVSMASDVAGTLKLISRMRAAR